MTGLVLTGGRSVRFGRDKSRFVLPGLAIVGSIFMIAATVLGHRMACLWYLIVFAIVTVIGLAFYKDKK